MLSFSYDIVSRGQHPGAPLTRGYLFVADLESAKRLVQGVNVRNLNGQSDLEVILCDQMGNEIWRGPYLSGGDA